jgi:hypothetical protein
MTHELFGAFDIDGDGRLEIIIKSFGYESITQTIYSVNDTDLVKRLEWFCGS